MDLDEIEGTCWWRVCVAAGWISHPCLFHLPSALMQRESRQSSPCFPEMWQSIMLFSALVLFDDLLSPMKPQPLVRRGQSGGWGWVGASVMDIFVWCERWDENPVGEHLLSASLCVKAALCCFHLISRTHVRDGMCIKSVPGKCGHWPICALQTSS